MSEFNFKNNKYGFQVGNIAILDAGHPNWCKVKIIYLTQNELFATVHQVDQPESTAWDTMTNRLSPVKL